MGSGLSRARLDRMHAILTASVERGELPGLVTLLARRGEVYADAIGALAFGGAPMRRDTIFRISSMTSNQLTPEQRVGAELFFRDSSSWGFGMAVYTRRCEQVAPPGRFGWDGGLGTLAYSDPAEEFVGILLTQSAWTSPTGPQLATDLEPQFSSPGAMPTPWA